MTALPLSLAGKVGTATLGALSGAPAESKDMEQLKKAAKAFEAVFIRQMLGEVRASGGEGLTDSSAVEQFQEMSDAKTADTLSERGAFGIAAMLVKQLAPKHAAAAYTATGSDGVGKGA